MEKPLQILYLEDNPFDAGLTRHALKRWGKAYNLLIVESEVDFTNALDEFNPDIVLSDHSLPGFNSMEAFNIVQQKKAGTPFVLLTGSVSEQYIAECIQAGVDEYILKNNLVDLPMIIDRILSKRDEAGKRSDF